MDFSKVMTVALSCTLLVYSGVCGSCNINLTAFTADCSFQNLSKVPSYIPDSTKVLDLSGNRFKEVNLRQFRRFYNLVELNLGFNDIKHLINDSDTELSTLRVLDISYNRRLQDLNSAFFASIPNLQKLSIRGNDLEVSMFKGLRNLTYLDMSDNKPISVNSTPFIELKYLEDLNLGWCRPQNLSNTMFTGLSNLLKLNLFGNHLQHLPSGVFVRFPILKVLDLSSNVLDSLPSGIFVGLTKLKVLDLSYNLLYYSTSLPTDIFQPLIHLEDINLLLDRVQYANYTYMDKQISKIPTLKRLHITGAPNAKFGPGFTVLENLEYLEISGNLSEINNETFFNLRYTRSLTLSLGSCQFNSISQNAFTILKNLTSLNISYNKGLCKLDMRNELITAICNSRVKYLTATRLFCPYTIGIWWSCDAPYLEFLDMSYSNVNSVKFGSPVSLKEILLTNNKISYFDGSTLYNMYNLRKLDISYQTSGREDSNTHLKLGIKRTTRDSTEQYRLYTLPSAQLYNITTTHTDLLKTSQNAILTIGNKSFEEQTRNMTFKVQPRNTWYIPAFLEWIDVSKSSLICSLLYTDNTDNTIRTLNVSYFVPTGGYDCTTLDKMLKMLWPWLDNLKMLEDLNLSGNHIKNIPVGAFKFMTHLKYLNLTQNSLFTLTFETKSLMNLKEMHLSNNVILYASSQFTTGIKSNDLKIYLDDNELLCDCARSSFAQWLCTTKVVYNITGLMCKYENGTQVSLRHRAAIYQQLRDECIYVIVTVTCVLAFIFLLIGGFGVTILLHKRWKQQYLSVFGRHSVNPYHPLEECQIEREYDIYISYERDHYITAQETMHDFVTQKLYPWLKRRGFKVLIRDELYAGRKLYSEISEALRKTRKVIVLLSNDYCVDFWNVFEFNSAAMEGIYTKRQVIIPVTFEILKPELFHEEINAFLKSGPLPRYTPVTNFTKLADYLLEKLSC